MRTAAGRRDALMPPVGLPVRAERLACATCGEVAWKITVKRRGFTTVEITGLDEAGEPVVVESGGPLTSEWYASTCKRCGTFCPPDTVTANAIGRVLSNALGKSQAARGA